MNPAGELDFSLQPSVARALDADERRQQREPDDQRQRRETDVGAEAGLRAAPANSGPSGPSQRSSAATPKKWMGASTAIQPAPNRATAV